MQYYKGLELPEGEITSMRKWQDTDDKQRKYIKDNDEKYHTNRNRPEAYNRITNLPFL